MGEEREESDRGLAGAGAGAGAGASAGRGARADKAPLAAQRKRGATLFWGFEDEWWGGVGGQGDAGRRLYWSIRLCHTRGAADNFITSSYKNDCGRANANGSPVPAARLFGLGGRRRHNESPGSSSRAPAPLGLTPSPPWL